jgi:putative protease
LHEKDEYKFRREWRDELDTISNRGYTTGFAFAEEKINETNPDIKYIQTHEPAGIVLQYDAAKKMMLVGVRNHLTAGDNVELLLPDDTIKINTRTMVDAKGNSVREANNDNQIYLPVEKEIPAGAILRQKTK